jgi:hypothetical protein
MTTTTTALPAARYVDLIQQEVARFADVARRTVPDTWLVSYPGYQAGSLTTHIGAILTRSEELLRTGVLPDYGTPVAVPAGTEPVDWITRAADAFVATAGGIDGDLLVPTYPLGDRKPARNVLRTVVTEVALHRWDLESATGEHAPVAPDLAVDLIDSIFEVYAPNSLANRRVGLFLGGTVLFAATDTDARWRVSVVDGALRSERVDATATADATVMGAVHELLVALWKRTPLAASGLAVSGEGSLVERFLRIPYIPDPQTTAAH